MKTKRIKNGFGFCASVGCKHLMSTSFELVRKDKEGKVIKRAKFCLCEDCTDEFLQEMDRRVVVNESN